MLRYYQKFEQRGEPALLCGLTDWVFEEALVTGSLGTLLVVNHQLFITVRFKKI